MSKNNPIGDYPPIVCHSCKHSSVTVQNQVLAPVGHSMKINVSDAIQQADEDDNNPRAYQAIKDQFEPVFLVKLLTHAGNNKQKAARISGISVSSINAKLKQHGLVITKKVCVRGGEL